MTGLLILTILIVAFLILDVLALAFGTDSREGWSR